MSRNYECAIVIPTYKPIKDLNHDEQLSLHTIQMLNRDMGLDLIYVAPNDIDVARSCLAEFFHPEYFKSIHTYSKLLLSYEFWQRFSKYKYVLIYQLDCLLFKRNILDWCKLGYSYIGAPWTEGYSETSEHFTMVGNGGFSLRNVADCLNIFSIIGNPEYIPTHPEAHEDVVWSIDIPRAFPFTKFSVAPVDIALRFSWELNPRTAQRISHLDKPLGCHGFNKREREFFISLLED